MTNTLDRFAPTGLAKGHAAADFVTLAAAAVALAGGSRPGVLLAALAVALLCAWVVVAAGRRAYHPGAHPRLRDHAATLLVQGAGGAAALAVLSDAVCGGPPAPALLAGWASALAADRLCFAGLERLLGRPAQAVVVVGTGPLARALARRVDHPRSGVRIAGFIPLPGEAVPAELGGRLLGPEGSLPRVLWNAAIDEVYVVGDPARHAEPMQDAVRFCEELGMPFALPAHALRLERAVALGLARHDLGFIHHVSTQPRPAARALKRLLDVAAALAALVVLAPLLAGVAAAIKLTNPGPVLFRQRRVGLHGRAFDMLKFRSMVVNAEALQERLAARNEVDGPVFKIRDDPRVFPLGRFIRRYSIDELPQLLNVLRGEMSVVGPRPPLPREVDRYEPWQRRRLSVRPGLTCHWQVSGRNNVTFEEWMLLDLRYVDQWSLLTDLRLVARTIPAVLSGNGAS